MKTLLAVVTILAVLAASCGQPLRRQVLVYAIDFRPYAEQGFLFTFDRYGGDYDAMGILKVVVLPGVLKTTQKVSTSESAYPFPQNTKFTTYEAEDLTAETVLAELHRAARELGADAVVELSIGRVNDPRRAEGWGSGIEASGFAIKRKGAFTVPEPSAP